jgi:hypothetical protein
VSKKGRGRRSSARRLEDRDNRSSVGYLRNLQASVLREERDKFMAELAGGDLLEEFEQQKAQLTTEKQ